MKPPKPPKQSTFDFVKPRSKICPCGSDKPASRLICDTCWKSAPAEARAGFCGPASDYTTRPTAIRSLLAHAAARRP